MINIIRLCRDMKKY